MAARDGDIDLVTIWIDGCAWELDAAACLAATPFTPAFTIHTLGSADRIALVAGQQVLISVDLGFTAAP